MLAADLPDQSRAVGRPFRKGSAPALGTRKYPGAALPYFGVLNGLFEYRDDIGAKGTALGHGDLLGLAIELVWDLTDV
jgi:hypothetical protein